MHSKIFLVICTILSNCLLAQTNLPDIPVNYPEWEPPKIDRHLSDKSNQQKPKKESDPFADYINDQISADQKKEIERKNELFESAAPTLEYKDEGFRQRSFLSSDALEFKESPCWSKIGYNPDLSKEIMRGMYKECESQLQKRESNKIIKIVSGLVLFGLLFGLVYYILNANKRKWNKLKNRYDTDFAFRFVIDDLLIPDNISFEKYFANKYAFEKKSNKSNVYPTYSMKKYFLDEAMETAKFPDWFIFAYPDVTVWYQKTQSYVYFSSLSSNEEIRKFLKQLVAGFKGLAYKLEVA